ncbi:MAG: serine/threonine-protein kinase [Isosphaeraceae bacterium]
MAPASEKIKVIFLEALDKATLAERTAFLDEACALDHGLRQHVDALLQAHDRPDPLLDHSAAEHLGVGPAEIIGPDDWLDFLEPPRRPDSLGRLAHYELLEVVERGAFRTVLKAFDEKLERLVAVKVMSPHFDETSAHRRRFLREARSAAAVRHENVIAIHAVEDQPVPYLVMEYVAGQTLRQKLDAAGALEVPEVLRIGLQIARGLAAAHAMGLIHRDIKPSNILLETGVDRVKIADFGLARAADDGTISPAGIIAGTPMYMAPEQATGAPIDQRADLFSFGSVLYTMCTGQPPFQAASAVAVLESVVKDTPRPIREIVPEVPEWLCELIARLHAKNAADRPASAQEVADLLKRHSAERSGK